MGLFKASVNRRLTTTEIVNTCSYNLHKKSLTYVTYLQENTKLMNIIFFIISLMLTLSSLSKKTNSMRI